MVVFIMKYLVQRILLLFPLLLASPLLFAAPPGENSHSEEEQSKQVITQDECT